MLIEIAEISLPILPIAVSSIAREALAFNQKRTTTKRSMEAVGEREWLTIREASALLGLSRSKLTQLLAEGEIEAFKAGKAVRISRSSLDSYTRRRTKHECPAHHPHR